MEPEKILLIYEDGSLSLIDADEIDDGIVDSVKEGILDVIRHRSNRFYQLFGRDAEGKLDWAKIVR